MTRHAFWALLLAVAVLSLMPTGYLPPQVFSLWDKAQHALAFAALAGLGLRAYPRHPWHLATGLLVFGGAIELAQAATRADRKQLGQLLPASRMMGEQLMQQGPLTMAACTAGSEIVIAVGPPLAIFYKGMKRDGDERATTAQLKADQDWWNSVKPEFAAYAQAREARLRAAGLDPKLLETPDAQFTPEQRRKFDPVCDQEADAEAALVRKALARRAK